MDENEGSMKNTTSPKGENSKGGAAELPGHDQPQAQLEEPGSSAVDNYLRFLARMIAVKHLRRSASDGTSDVRDSQRPRNRKQRS
jgi:hypothetical protein